MSLIIPKQIINVLQSFNDIGVSLYGIPCDLYIPTNTTTLEPEDLYTSTTDVTYQKYSQVSVWVEWCVRDVHRLRKLGFFAENESPILARFNNLPEVVINSYIEVEIQYIPAGAFDTTQFEVVDVLMQNTYSDEIYKYFRLAPLRKKNT